MSEATASLARTPLWNLHRRLGARLVPFAGYEMPLHFRGIVSEHLHARDKAVLFDVSHMGQVRIVGEPTQALEQLVVGDVRGLANGRLRYTLLTDDDGGILDDLMVLQGGYYLDLVVNAATKHADVAHLRARLPEGLQVTLRDDLALLALQGPAAATVLGRHAPAARLMLFMTAESLKIGDFRCTVSRSGYTGEDGFEISVAAAEAEALARLLLAEPEVAPAGLGARDTLRLEAGLCLYGQDIDRTTTPVEAGLGWTIGRRRREEGGFPGDEIILRQLLEGPARRRVGIAFDAKRPVRAGAPILGAAANPIGSVTSGTWSPTLAAPIAMGYVEAAYAEPDTPLSVVVRDTAIEGRVVRLPFVAHRYARA